MAPSHNYLHTLRALAKRFNDTIGEQEGYDPVGEDWILREFAQVFDLGYENGYADAMENADL